MKTVKVYCPFCKKEHDVEPRGVLCVQLVDKSVLAKYKCLIYNKEFTVKK